MPGLNYRCHEPRHSYDREFRAKSCTSKTERSKVPKATMSPTLRDLEWAAGFLEGEGNFRGASKGEGTARVRCCQVNREPMDRLVAMFGGRLGYVVRKTPNCQNVYQWEMSGARARGIMMTLYPMMSEVRKKQIADALPGRK